MHKFLAHFLMENYISPKKLLAHYRVEILVGETYFFVG